MFIPCLHFQPHLYLYVHPNTHTLKCTALVIINQLWSLKYKAAVSLGCTPLHVEGPECTANFYLTNSLKLSSSATSLRRHPRISHCPPSAWVPPLCAPIYSSEYLHHSFSFHLLVIFSHRTNSNGQRFFFFNFISPAPTQVFSK